eukprot:6262624-Prymnesium_polylepis.1
MWKGIGSRSHDEFIAGMEGGHPDTRLGAPWTTFRTDPFYTSRLVDNCCYSLFPDCCGLFADAQAALAQPWPFDFTTIQCAATFFHGAKDATNSIRASRYHTEVLGAPRAKLVEFPDDGHVTIIQSDHLPSMIRQVVERPAVGAQA